jgi:vancomycin resistance protein YoaR
LPLLLFALGYARFAASDRVLAGITLGGVEVAGLSARDAERKLVDEWRPIAARKLRLATGNASMELGIEELGFELRPRDSVARALSMGRNQGLFTNAFRYLRSFFSEERLPLALKIERSRFATALKRAQASLVVDPPFPGALMLENAKPMVSPPRAGRTIPEDSALAAISETVAQGRTGATVTLDTQLVEPTLVAGSLERARSLAERMLSAPVILTAGSRRLELAPAELAQLLESSVRERELQLALDSERLAAWLGTQRPNLEAPARDARFEVSAADEVRVVPSEPGVRLDDEKIATALLAAAQSDGHRGELPLLLQPLPARSTEQAEKLGIRKLVGSFTTRHPCCQPRVDNIHRVASLLDGLVVEPGQTVSVNAIVGPRTQKNGFVLAPSIEDGEMVDTVGGGVSQFATTFFNALFRAGYDIIERKPHTYWFPRYPMGIEATLSWPHPDIVFKNDSEAGLLVKTSFTDKSITVKLYGDTGGRRVRFDVSDRRDIVQPSVELLPNRGVPSDEEEVKEGGMIGWSVIVSRTVTFADGSKKDEKRKVTYKPKPRRVDVHPCRIPKGEPGATGEPCPEPEPKPDDEAEPEAAPQPG